MEGKVAVVTGSNKGIGLGIVKNLCSLFKGTVYLTARDVGKGLKAVEELKTEGLKPAFHQLDVTDPQSINAFARFIESQHGGIDILVSNAGVAFLKEENWETFFGPGMNVLNTNYFAVKNVCNALFPLLRPHARVVIVSSSYGLLLRIPSAELRQKFSDQSLTEESLDRLIYDFIRAADDNAHSEQGWPNSTYIVSKVGVSALTRLYHKKFLKDSREDIVINHVHPGYVATDLTNHKGTLSIAQGADAPTYLALLPENCRSPNGDFVWYTREIVDWIDGPIPAE